MFSNLSYAEKKDFKIYDTEKKLNEPAVDSLFITEWFTHNECVYAYGFKENVAFGHVKVPICISLFVLSKLPNLDFLRCINGVVEIELVETDYNSTEISIFQRNENFNLFRIRMDYFDQVMALYYELKKNKTPVIYCAPSYDLTTMLLLEFRHKENLYLYGEITVTSSEFKKDHDNINFKRGQPKLRVASFDIETVSDHNFRVPTGENINDIVYSISIYFIQNNIRFLYSIINYPLLVKPQVTYIKHEGYDVHKIIEVLSEKELLIETMKLFDSFNEPTYLIGYNSHSYDLPFLLCRCSLYSLNFCNNFRYVNGALTYQNLIHLDLLKFMRKYFSFTSYKLSNVASEILKTYNKDDINAVEIRFVYRDLEKTKQIKENYKYSNNSFTLADIVKYNEKDTIVVLKLFDMLAYSTVLWDICNENYLNINRIAESQQNEYLNYKLFFQFLKTKHFCVALHEDRYIVTKNYTILVNGENLVKSSSGKFAGGFNYSGGIESIKNIVMYDFVTYYPKIMEMGISIENTVVLDGKTVKLIYSELVSCKLCKFTTHKGENLGLTNKENDVDIASRLYLADLLPNVPEILSLDEIANDDKIIVVKYSKSALLSKFIIEQNRHREVFKTNKSVLDGLINRIDNEIATKELISESDNSASSNSDSSDDEIEISSSSALIVHTTNSTGLRLKIYNNVKKLPLNILYEYKKLALGEFARFGSFDTSKKTENSSVYGLLGSNYGILSNKAVAAAVTCKGRENLIKTILFVENLGVDAHVFFADTDSLMVKCGQNYDPSIVAQYTKETNPELVLNSKIYKLGHFFKKKVYLFNFNEEWQSRGINRTGPMLWDRILILYANKLFSNETITVATLRNELFSIFHLCVDKFKDDLSESFITTNLKSRESYSTNTPTKILLDRLHVETQGSFIPDKTLATTFKYVNSPQTVFKVCDFETVTWRDINIYKYLSKIHKPLYGLISENIYKSNLKVNKTLKLTFNEFDKIMIDSYVAFRYLHQEEFN